MLHFETFLASNSEYVRKIPGSNLHQPRKYSPRHTRQAGPRRKTFPASRRTSCVPPGACTFTDDSARLVAMAATADAHDPVPEDIVSPAPRSKNRTFTSCLPAGETHSTLTPCSNRPLF